MRLALFRKLTKVEQEKETAKAKIRIQKAYEKLCRLGAWHKAPKDFPKKVNEYVLWSRKADIVERVI